MSAAALTHGSYLILLLGCLVITAPLEFVLGARVHRRWRATAYAILPVVLIFTVWDLIGIWRGHWWYAPERITGLHLGPMPIEELCFFLVIPLCGLLTFEAVGRILSRRKAGVTVRGDRQDQS
ncbi:lycopene cyclase domain-containing protein [Propionibacteriaceae bacterium Y1700]|uniref:lycopene cyclase domain-containing protein n=1 Tax=Microlunatus sp. Y1700 TaxID=3418487 RepID=UPI003DA72375